MLAHNATFPSNDKMALILLGQWHMILPRIELLITVFMTMVVITYMYGLAVAAVSGTTITSGAPVCCSSSSLITLNGGTVYDAYRNKMSVCI